LLSSLALLSLFFHRILAFTMQRAGFWQGERMIDCLLERKLTELG
jgi:hypothetical protein